MLRKIKLDIQTRLFHDHTAGGDDLVLPCWSERTGQLMHTLWDKIQHNTCEFDVPFDFYTDLCEYRKANDK